ncbi:hypothetical protein BJY16_003639 [Actinoplanes octamycinicus]|uniref:Uncharacterized protein n=1 Tax=Actinoplanes octamycinicus TaxID=135948 RepID=A0A7W7GXJ5_9ACTN|nr:hypothetical protein [Actinoplanes octamycinicus]MBB4740180.1 hypothetical protein [Actinoplanes octamycinicus]GIE59577.1 hypothetical protein Aoc01nite_49790 [Actinoplanes octamycinicus]
MQIIRHKTVKAAFGLPLAIALSAGLGLAAGAARPASAGTVAPGSRTGTAPAAGWNVAIAQLMADAAAPALITSAALPAELAGATLLPGASPLPAAAADGKPDPARLKAALLVQTDLPHGYAPMPDALKAFADTGSTIGACDKAAEPPADKPGTPAAKPGTPAGKPGTPAGPGIAQPVAPDRPVAPGEPTGPGLPVQPSLRVAASPTGGPKPVSDTVRTAFMKGETGPILIEALNPAGDRAARDIVAQVADTPRRCPAYDEGKPGSPDALHMATHPLTVPRLGSKAAGIRFEVVMTSPRVTVHGKMIAVAVRGVALTVLLANLEEPDQHELEAITRAAVRKLKNQK